MRTHRFAGLLLVPAFVLAGYAPVVAGKAPARAPGTTVEMPYLIAPVVVDGTLYANAYISNQIIATSPAATIVVRDKLAFIQDAFVRDVNAAPIGKPADPATVDASALAARLLSDVKRIVGPGQVNSVQIIRIQINQLHAGAHS
jgi:hypothetical protein